MSYVVLSTLWWLINALLDICWFVVIAAVIASWLIAFGVLNTRNEFVRQVVRFLDAITDPIFRRIRRIIPPIGGLDLSPVFVLLAIALLQVFTDRLFTWLIYHP